MTPNKGVFLVYPEGTVTAKYAQTIRHRATTSPLRSHIQEKNQCSDSTMEKTKWQADGKAMKAMIKRRTSHETCPCVFPNVGATKQVRFWEPQVPRLLSPSRET
jgi:hypothetical protein